MEVTINSYNVRVDSPEQINIAELYSILVKNDPRWTGSFAKVYLYCEGQPEKCVVLKVQEETPGWERRWANVLTKCKNAKDLVVQVVAFAPVPGSTPNASLPQVAVLMEYADGQSLGDYMTTEIIQPQIEFSVVILLLRTLHVAGVRHGDPNPRNIILLENGLLKFVDIGPSGEYPDPKAFADFFALLAYSDWWYNYYNSMDWYYSGCAVELQKAQKLQRAQNAAGDSFPKRDFNLLFEEQSEEALYLNELNARYVNEESFPRALQSFEDVVNSQLAEYKGKVLPWDQSFATGVVYACRRNRSFRLAKLLTKWYSKLSSEKRYRRRLLRHLLSPKNDKFPFKVKEGSPSYQRAQKVFLGVAESLIQTYTTPLDQNATVQVLKDMENLKPPAYYQALAILRNDIAEFPWKIEIVSAYAAFIEEYQRSPNQDRFNVRLTDQHWKELAFANVYVRRYPSLYLDV